MMTPIEANKRDYIFALLYFLIGYGFVYIFTGEDSEIKFLGLYTVLYIVINLLYLYAKGKKPTKESYFWLAIMLFIAMPYSFWSVLGVFQIIALIFVAAYWSLAVSDRLLGGSTSKWIFFDWWNSMAKVPFSNFTCQFRVLKEGADQKRKIGSSVVSVFLGMVVAVPVLIIVLPLLFRADAGFETFAGNLVRNLISENLIVTAFKILLSIPVSCYLYGLIYGGISGRNTNRINQDKIRQTGKKIRKMPDMTTATAMALICMVYLVFIGIQGNYLFSAFLGKMPEGFTYAEYARRGFFELCEIGAWNLIILILASLISRTPRAENISLKIMSVILSAFTILLITTAVSKMGMYIYVYGLTVNRVLTITFMIWMVIVFLFVIVQQKKTIPLVKICVMAGAVLFSLLCIFPLERWIEIYNLQR